MNYEHFKAGRPAISGEAPHASFTFHLVAVTPTVFQEVLTCTPSGRYTMTFGYSGNTYEKPITQAQYEECIRIEQRYFYEEVCAVLDASRWKRSIDGETVLWIRGSL